MVDNYSPYSVLITKTLYLVQWSKFRKNLTYYYYYYNPMYTFHTKFILTF